MDAISRDLLVLTFWQVFAKMVAVLLSKNNFSIEENFMKIYPQLTFLASLLTDRQTSRDEHLSFLEWM